MPSWFEMKEPTAEEWRENFLKRHTTLSKTIGYILKFITKANKGICCYLFHKNNDLWQ